MHIVTVASQKGGAGKTTLARNIAVAGVTEGHTTVLLDTDPQGSLTDWWNRRGRDSPALIRYDGNLIPLLNRLRDSGDGLVLVDTPPSVHRFVRSIVDVSDLVLVPVRPSPDDLAAVGATLGILSGRRWAFVLCQTKARSRLTNEAARVLAGAGDVVPTHVVDRVEYAMSAAVGLGVTESQPHGAAADEIRVLLAYVLRQLRTPMTELRMDVTTS